MKLEGKTAIVTGSTMGIGKSIAQHLAKGVASRRAFQSSDYGFLIRI